MLRYGYSMRFAKVEGSDPIWNGHIFILAIYDDPELGIIATKIPIKVSSSATIKSIKGVWWN